MVTPIEIALVLVALLAVLVAYRILKKAKALAVNAIVGVVLLLIADVLLIEVQITVWAVIICAFAGIPGAILVVLLAYLDIAFAAAVAALALL